MTGVLPDATARALITGEDPDGLAQTLFVEAGAGSGKTGSLVARVLALVASGVELRHIAAITFTDKAATELRDRIRGRLERAERTATDPAERATWRRALEQVDMAALSTLHAFAQRLLTEHPLEAGLPPNVELLDEVASEIEFEERWRDHRDRILADGHLGPLIELALAAGVKFPDDLRQLALEFERNWDLATDPDRVPWTHGIVPTVDVGDLVGRLREVASWRDQCTDPTDTLALALQWHVEGLADLLDRAADDVTRLRLLDPDGRLPIPDRNGDMGDGPLTFRLGSKGRKGNWPDGVKDQCGAAGEELVELRAAARARVVTAILRQLAVSIARFVRQSADARVGSGRLEFHDLLVLARHLLRGPDGADVRNTLRQRYQRLLLDEFQDTDPIQVEIATLLASGVAGAGDQHWADVEIDPGRLFFVGDPKQSIYRFRRADIGLYLQARDVFAGGRPVQLSTNFRSSPAVIDWVNDVFGQLIEHVDGSQPEYAPLAASPRRGNPPVGPAVTVLGTDLHPYGVSATEVREREAAEVADLVLRAVADRWQVVDRDAADDGEPEGWRDARFGDITILLPARTSLPMLEDALTDRGIPYRSESSSLVYATRDVRDLLLTVRAIVDPTDQLALVAALRSHVFGCSDADLVTWRRQHGQRLSILASLDDAPSHPVGDALRYLRDLHDQLAWLTPAELLDRLCRDRQLFELGHATARPRDTWRRLRFVIDQARAWTEAEGGTLREYLAWARRQSSDSVRVAETILPETDDDSVRIMTVHASKGLQFPITVLSGTSARPMGRRPGVQVLWPPGGPVAIQMNARVTSEEYDAFQPLDEQMGHHERIRLLYVACTRAQDHLVVSLHRSERRSEPTDERRTSAELLHLASAGASHEVWEPAPTTARHGHGEPDVEPFDRDDWLAGRERALATSTRPRSIGATGVQELLRRELDDGDLKQPRDLDLPAWRKGRYGTAIGRAVHGVLQTVDLLTGDGLAEAAAAQAAAEGVVGREPDVEALARAALGANVVQQAARATERWRETYIAVPVGDRVLEGYVDLAFRSMEGLVIVDYKTASSATDLDTRLDHYRGQGGAYALALGEVSGEPVARVVFLFLTPTGAVERDLPDVAAAVDEVRRILEPVCP